jgi:hypothetical protein
MNKENENIERLCNETRCFFSDTDKMLRHVCRYCIRNINSDNAETDYYNKLNKDGY